MIKYDKDFHKNMRTASDKWESTFHPDAIKILLDEIERLQKREAWADCLENQGVDNWGGYVDALEEFNAINFDG